METQQSINDNNTSDVFSNFWSLASTDSSESVQAAQNLLVHLIKVQDTVAEKNKLHVEVEYCLNRLIKGLSSSRQSARLGFSVMLTELLRNLQQPINLPDITLSLLTDLTQVAGGNSKGQGERNLYFGHIFGIAALIKSGRYCVKEQSANLGKLIEQLVDLSGKKTYLTEICFRILSDVVGSPSTTANKKSKKTNKMLIPKDMFETCVVPHLLPLYTATGTTDAEVEGGNNAILGPELLGVLLVINKCYKGTAGWESILNCVEFIVDKNDLLCERHFPAFKNILHCVSSVDSKILHNAWKVILQQMIDDKNFDRFIEFWNSVLDQGMFNSTHNRKYIGFQVMEEALTMFSCSGKGDSNTLTKFGTLFSEHLMRCFFNNISNKENYLYAAAVNLAEKIKLVNGNLAFIAVSKLLGANGHPNFDKYTKCNVVKTLIASLDAPSIEKYIEFYQNSFLVCKPNRDIAVSSSSSSSENLDLELSAALENNRNIAVQREYAIDNICALVKNTQLQQRLGTGFRHVFLNVCKFISFHAYFTLVQPLPNHKQYGMSLLKTVPSPVVSKRTQAYCKQRLGTLLTLINTALNNTTVTTKTTTTGNGKKHSTTAPTAQNANQWLRVLYDFNSELIIQSSLHPEHLRNHLDEESLSVLQRAENKIAQLEQTIQSLTSKNGNKDTHNNQSPQRSLNAFLQLLLHCTLQMYSEPGEFTSIIDDILICYDKMNVTQFASGKKSKSVKASNDESEPSPVGVMTDIVISLLSQPSAQLRSLCNEIFAVVCDQIDISALQQIIDVIQMDYKTYQASLNNDDDEFGGEEEVEFDNNSDKDNESEEDESENSSNSDIDLEIDDNEMGEGVDDELKQKLMQVLGTPDNDDDSDEADYLNDEQMMSFDDKLAAIFKERKEQIQNKQIVKASFFNLQLRVFELLDVFIKNQPNSPLIVHLINPLMIALRQHCQSSAKQAPDVANRCKGLLVNKIVKSKPCVSDEGSNEVCVQVLKDIVKLNSYTPFKPFHDASTHVINHVLNVLINNNKTERCDWLVGEVKPILESALVHFTSKKASHHKFKLFQGIVDNLYAKIGSQSEHSHTCTSLTLSMCDIVSTCLETHSRSDFMASQLCVLGRLLCRNLMKSYKVDKKGHKLVVKALQVLLKSQYTYYTKAIKMDAKDKNIKSVKKCLTMTAATINAIKNMSISLSKIAAISQLNVLITENSDQLEGMMLWSRLAKLTNEEAESGGSPIKRNKIEASAQPEKPQTIKPNKKSSKKRRKTKD